MSFFIGLIKGIYAMESERLKTLAVALRVARFASDKEFDKFMESRDDKSSNKLPSEFQSF